MPFRIGLRKEVNPEAPDAPRPTLEWLSSVWAWKVRKDQPTALPEESNIIHRPFLLIRLTLRVLGLVPFTYVKGTYQLKWCSLAAVHAVFVMLWFTALVVSTAVGITRLFSSDVFSNSQNHAMELMGVGIIASCLLNAWVDAINTLYYGRLFCDFLNSWHRLAHDTGLNPTVGLRRSSCIHSLFLFTFVVAMAISSLIGPPAMLLQIIKRLAQVLLLIPEEWLEENTLTVKVALALVALVVCHVYMCYKGSLLIFVSSCKMLKNVLKDWRMQLTNALDAIWREGEGEQTGAVGFDQLVQSHWRVVQMVRNTEKLFSVALQCFYASQVVTMCLELYLVAYRVGMQTHYERGEALWQSLIITQTFTVFLLVSIQASAVYEEAEASVDVLRRGLPYNAPDCVKFHFSELITSLTGSPICITGGKFFYIHRPFIITVVGAVLSYFIIILQLMLPSVGRDRGGEAPLANLTLSDQEL
ncbi:uncharacterized protein [Penaeus vannamei]|uniref:uncharacterized protein n=1 Tax=Penaeus vannamei TaxID=6689 RepID=UPI00387FAD11